MRDSLHRVFCVVLVSVLGFASLSLAYPQLVQAEEQPALLAQADADVEQDAAEDEQLPAEEEEAVEQAEEAAAADEDGAQEDPVLSVAASMADLFDDDIWIKQGRSGTCTLASAAMMLRRAALLNGNAQWRQITEDSLAPAAWYSGVGLRWSFSYMGMQVEEEDVYGSNEVLLMKMLANHPEGVVVYNWAHAVLLTHYEDGVFYCADPAFGDLRPLEESSRSVNPYNIQQIWYVSSNVNPPSDDDWGWDDGNLEPDDDEPADVVVDEYGWELSGSRWRYKYEDGSYACGGVRRIDGAEYRFDDDGYMVTGWYFDNGNWYYSLDTGQVCYSWVIDNGSWYFLDRKTGVMQTGWLTDGNKRYFLRDNGAMATDWVFDNKKWYYLNDDGEMETGWITLGGVRYYLNNSGVMQTGLLTVDGNTYYLNNSGAMQNGWQLINKTWYFFNTSGVMAKGWLKDGGVWYYLLDSGAMQTGWLLDGKTWYYLRDSGAMATGWLLDGKTWYYLDGSGAMAANAWIGNYYVGANGSMLVNTITPDGYRVDANGAWDGKPRVS